MSTPVRPQAGAQEPEHLVASLRSHGRAMFWPSIILIATVGGAFFFYGRFTETWQNVAVAAGAILLIILCWLLPLLGWLSRKYTITTRRIILRRGFFVRIRQELLHSRGYDVTVRKNALQAMFGSGDVRINTGLEHPVVLKDVPGANLVQSALHDLMEKSTNPIAARRQATESTPPDETMIFGSR